MCKRQSHWLALTDYCRCFDFSESVRADADNVINIHESSSSLILIFYIVLINTILLPPMLIIIIINIISIIVRFSLCFFLQKR